MAEIKAESKGVVFTLTLSEDEMRWAERALLKDNSNHSENIELWRSVHEALEGAGLSPDNIDDI